MLTPLAAAPQAPPNPMPGPHFRARFLTTSLTLQTPTGVAGAKAPVGLALFPNPAHNAFTLNNLPPTALTAILRNALGQEVRRVALRPAGGQAEVAVAGLPAGVYAVQVLGAGATAVRRLVVE